MNKRVLVIAGPSIPVPPDLYGGTERIIAMVNEGLVERGYRVDMIAASKSKTYGGKNFSYDEPGLNIFRRVFQRLKFYYGSLMLGIGADLVINCGRLDYMQVIFALRKKVINPFHNPITHRDVLVLKKQGSLIWPVAISNDQISDMNAGINFDVIYNSADSVSLTYDEFASRTYYVFIGRLTRNKGVDKAIQLAIKSKIHLKIAGPIPNCLSENFAFFTEHVQPFFSSEFIEYVGLVNEKEKNDLFANAIASFFPISWKEPFGLTVIESLLCGVPVIASDMASLPEIMDTGKTGFLCRSEADFLAAIQDISTISNAYCRSYSLKRFNRERMIQEYIDLVIRVISFAS